MFSWYLDVNLRCVYGCIFTFSTDQRPSSKFLNTKQRLITRLYEMFIKSTQSLKEASYNPSITPLWLKFEIKITFGEHKVKGKISHQHWKEQLSKEMLFHAS